MKAIIEFNLPEENEEFEIHRKAFDMSRALSEIENYIRGRMKHESPGKMATKDLEKIRSIIAEWTND